MAKRRLPKVLVQAEVDALLAAAREAADQAPSPSKQFAAWRDFVMVQTGLLAGGRVSELCGLDVTDVNYEPPVITIRHGKGDKDRNVPIASKLLPALREWIGERQTGPLFTGPKGKRLAERTFQVRLDKLARRAKIAKHVHPHILRHTFACSLLRTGADVREIQELMGHANLATTAVYLHVDMQRLQAALDRL